MGKANLKLQENFPKHSCLQGLCAVISEKLQKKGDSIYIRKTGPEIKFPSYLSLTQPLAVYVRQVLRLTRQTE